VACYRAGVLVNDLVALFHVEQIRFRSMSEPMGCLAAPELEQRKVDESVQLYQAAQSVEFFSGRLGMRAPTISQHLARAGIKLRARCRPSANVASQQGVTAAPLRLNSAMS
jgi:hypothetical protein